MTTNQNTTSQDARDALKIAESEHGTLENRQRDACEAVERAMTAVQNEGSASAGKALLAAEDAARISAIAMAGSSQRLDHARERLAQAEQTERTAVHEARAGSVSFMSFAAASNPIAIKLAEARARVAEAEAEAAALCNGFTQEAASVADDARKLGVPGAPTLKYTRLLASLTARVAARGRVEDTRPAARILAEVWNVRQPAGVSPEDALSAIERGVELTAIAHCRAELERAKDGQARAAQKLLAQGYARANPNQDRSTTPLGQLQSCSRAAESARARLRELGFSGAADSVREDALVSRLLAIPPLGNISGAQRIGELVSQLRSVDYASVPGARNQHETAAGRERLAAELVAQLDALGFADVAAQVRTHRRAAAAMPSGFVNVGL